MRAERRIRVAVIAFQVLVPVALIVQHLGPAGTYATLSDAARYRALVLPHARPYAAFPSEYPPLALITFKLLGPASFTSFTVRLIALQAACQLIIVSSMYWGWGSEAAWKYLLFSAPLLVHNLTTFDLVAVAFVTLGSALLARGRREGVAGVFVAAGAFVKVYSVLLVPLYAARRQWRTTVGALVVLVGGGLAWVAYGGTGAISQVVTYRGARGWHIDSVPGSALYLVTRDAPHFTAGTLRVGAPSGACAVLLGCGLAATVGWVCYLATTRDVPAGLAEMTIVTATLVWATLLSIQFVSWLLPWSAIVVARKHRRIEQLTWLVVALTFVIAVLFDPKATAESVLLEVSVLARNVVLAVLLATSLNAMLRAKLPEPNGTRKSGLIGPSVTTAPQVR